MSDGISKEALARKKAFQKFKKELGGEVNDHTIWEHKKKQDWKLYFNDVGEIVCLTSEKVKPQKHWKTYDFTNEQLAVLREPGVKLNKYIVLPDQYEENVYKIEVKPIDSVYTNAEKDFLSEITPGKSADITVEVTTKELCVTLDREIVKENYSKVYPVSATIKGARLLKFFVTAKGNPHILYHCETISLSELIIEDVVKRKLPADCRDYSVYTIKHFDTYSRV